MTKKLSCIFLVDDDSDVNMIVTYLINKENLAEKIATALNGEEALDYLKKNPPPDLILLDINMPRMNGWEFLEEYKKLSSEIRQSVVIVMVTVSLNPEDRERAEQTGIAFVNKPLTAAVLRKIIDDHWG